MEPISFTFMSLRSTLVDHDFVVSHAVKLLRLRAYLPCNRDADIVVGEHLVHGGDIACKLRRPPLFFQQLNLALGLMLFFRRCARLKPCAERHLHAHQNSGGSPQQVPDWTDRASHSRTGC